jgi:predicted secreted protein
MSVRRLPRMVIVVTAIAIASSAVIAAPPSSAEPQKKNITLTLTTLPAQVRLNPGESVRLMLVTNLTTGYTWSTRVAGKKASVGVSVGAYTAPATDLVGAPGTTSWIVTAKAKGTAVVKVLTTPPGAKKPKVDGSLTVIVQ